jgi:Fe-coproporphyrin III synthase
MKGGPLWLGFGNLRDKVVDKLKDLRKKYSDFVINSEKKLSLMKGNWDGKAQLQFNVHLGPYFLWTI